MEIENIRLSEKAKHQLIALKRKTGLETWNVLCRWAFCMSLAEAEKPPAETIPTDSSVEMTWRTFGGANADLYKAILRYRAHKDGIKEEDLPMYFRLHLHRGISYLSQMPISKIDDLLCSLKPLDAMQQKGRN
jgi:DNA sulfur modification protein DndE